MRERDWGRVIFVSSESGLQIPVEIIHYRVTKTAQIALARHRRVVRGATHDFHVTGHDKLLQGLRLAIPTMMYLAEPSVITLFVSNDALNEDPTIDVASP